MTIVKCFLTDVSGNDFSNSIWEADDIPIDCRKPIPSDSGSVRETFIRAKYEKRLFIEKDTAHSVPELYVNLLNSVKEKQFLSVVRLWTILSPEAYMTEREQEVLTQKRNSKANADKKDTRLKRSSIALFEAIRAGFIDAVVFFALNGADLRDSDEEGRDSVLLALSLGHREIYYFLDKYVLGSSAADVPVHSGAVQEAEDAARVNRSVSDPRLVRERRSQSKQPVNVLGEMLHSASKSKGAVAPLLAGLQRVKHFAKSFTAADDSADSEGAHHGRKTSE